MMNTHNTRARLALNIMRSAPACLRPTMQRPTIERAKEIMIAHVEEVQGGGWSAIALTHPYLKYFRGSSVGTRRYRGRIPRSESHTRVDDKLPMRGVGQTGSIQPCEARAFSFTSRVQTH